MNNPTALKPALDLIDGCSIEELDSLQKAIYERLDALSKGMQVGVLPGRNFGAYVNIESHLPDDTYGLAIAVTGREGRRFLPHTFLTHQLYMRRLLEIVNEHDPDFIEVCALSQNTVIKIWEKPK